MFTVWFSWATSLFSLYPIHPSLNNLSAMPGHYWTEVGKILGTKSDKGLGWKCGGCSEWFRAAISGCERQRTELHRYYDNVNNNNDCYYYFGITTNWDYGSDYSIKASRPNILRDVCVCCLAALSYVAFGLGVSFAGSRGILWGTEWENADIHNSDNAARQFKSDCTF